jgi:oxygen-dependent protoporphyrinogen oxidase
MVSKMKVVILGGGISGLACAYYLNKKATEAGKAVEITLVEKEAYWGGKIRTTIQDEFVVEGGPDSYLATKPEMRTLCRELGLEDGLQGTNPENSQTFILHKGKLTSIPEGLTMTIPTQFAPLVKTRLLSWPQKARMGLDFLIPVRRENSDESLAGFISRRLGRAAYDQLVGPLLSGIYAGDGNRLSLQSTFPSLRQMEMEYGGLIKGALALRRKRAQSSKQGSNGKTPKGWRSIFETHKAGLQQIVDAVVDRLQTAGVHLKLQTSASNVSKNGEQYQIFLDDGTELIADAVVLATPAYISGEMLHKLSSQLAALLTEIEYVTTATISFAFRKEDLPPLNGYGYIIPQHEKSQALACTWTSCKWDNRAPEGYALVRVFVGRIQDANALPREEDKLTAIARQEIIKTMGADAEPVLSWVFRWEKAMPQYNLGHPERLAQIEKKLQELPGLFLAGNGYHGIGMPDCIKSGENAAEQIIAQYNHMERIR